MTVAVLMSTYNGAKYLREQIESILNQTGDFSLELWVRDDGSCDDTLAILEEYKNKGQLKWYSGGNLGPAHSFLDLIKHCPGYDFYAFADQDDYWLPEKTSAGVSALQGKSVPALYCANADIVDANLKTVGRNVYRVSPRLDFETLMCASGLMGCTMVFNHHLAQIIQNHGMPGKITMHDAFLAEVCLTVGGELVFDRQAYMKYRQHGNNVVGVAHSFVQTVKGRTKKILTKDKIGIADNACELRQYGPINDEIAQWIDTVASYRENFLNRVMLAFSSRTRYMNFNLAVQYRLKILLGNR